MKKETILKTAICRFDPQEGVYVVQSAVFDRVIGAELSEKGAWKLYRELLDDMWEAHLEGKLADHAKPGRPAKGILNVNVQVTPEIRDSLRQNAKALGISQGDFVAFAIGAAEAHLASAALYADDKSLAKTLNVVAEGGKTGYMADKKADQLANLPKSGVTLRECASNKKAALVKAATEGKGKPTGRKKPKNGNSR